MNTKPITAVMLAAGVGSRLFNGSTEQMPKCLLQFNGRTLLSRHLEILESLNVGELSLVLGFQREAVLEELERAQSAINVEIIENERYREGSGLSLWHAMKVLRQGATVLFMDADVLYHPHLLERLMAASCPSSIPLDPHFEDGAEPVKVCIKDQRLVAFGKELASDLEFDEVGEWPGFMKLSASLASTIAERLDAHMSRGEVHRPYEDAMAEALLEAIHPELCFENVAGVPWIEIDFPEDLARAETHILPAIQQFDPDQ